MTYNIYHEIINRHEFQSWGVVKWVEKELLELRLKSDERRAELGVQEAGGALNSRWVSGQV